MKNRDIKLLLLKLFEESGTNSFSYEELCQNLRLGRQEKSSAKRILTELYDEGILVKEKKRY
ncbi:MAG: hypothetical protein PHI68_07085, partial [Candidatus Cloacimonetes bacterium]|nr:hypothetical protein [Candidatus Cloacimonadota bacterium]